MMTDQESANLLESLKRLFSRVIALRSEGRARSSTNHDTISSQNIVSSLSDYIDTLAANASNKPAGTVSSRLPESENVKHDRAPFSAETASSDKPGELSLHLKESHKYSGASLDTGERLMQSTWEHFHSAIRFGRQGDIAAAKIHIELTNNALKEAAHYLPDSVYSSFSKDVMKALEETNKVRPD